MCVYVYMIIVQHTVWIRHQTRFLSRTMIMRNIFSSSAVNQWISTIESVNQSVSQYISIILIFPYNIYYSIVELGMFVKIQNIIYIHN